MANTRAQTETSWHRDNPGKSLQVAAEALANEGNQRHNGARR